MSMTPPTTDDILTRCRNMGFAMAGIAPARPSDWGRQLTDWLAAGKHGEMDYLARYVEQRIDPARKLPGVQSIICVADRHPGGRDRTLDLDHRPRGRIARYARGKDYHRVMKKRLHALCDALSQCAPDETFCACVDTAPVLEREHAQRAGLGAVGKHTLLIEPGVGSYLLLGEILTTMKLEPTSSSVGIDPCGSCTKCIDACPTDAIEPWSVDATKCISYLTIEHRSEIDPSYHKPIGEWVFGCDICQEVCPHNQPTWRTRGAPVHEDYSSSRDSFDLLEILNWDEQAKRKAFSGSAMKRAKLPMMKRNALIVAGNALRRRYNDVLRRRIEAISNDKEEDAMVRRTAHAVLCRLGQGRADSQ